ncbi:RTX-I toxin determinant A from serotypes 1/9 [Prochlorococcus marinus str. MIT 1342]|uniref:calcium-binding protein n=1 Tax=Prochlorococcus TaxID=1218 RepID=UPI0007B38F19|nr:Calx-beta domain-containing protein [Prochlorococcus marinus]KZR83493.1 RTX-I toxin determinant A from serotypes 1/9 [Prochlorococcus marinus str. MIT 1342]
MGCGCSEPKQVRVSTFKISKVKIDEGDKASVKISRSGDMRNQIILYVSTEAGTATSGNDYWDVDDVFVFSPSQKTRRVTIETKDDYEKEDDETFYIKLSSSNPGAKFSSTSALVTIKDNDEAYSDGNDSLSGTYEGDYLIGDSNDDEIFGNQGNDEIYAKAGNDEVYGNQGNDEIYGNQGSDIAYGGQGDDVIFGGKDADYIYGNNGSDILYGNIGNDFLYGGQGDDLLFGGQNDDLLDGNKGNDSLNGNLGADKFVLGFGFDIVKDYNQDEGDTIITSVVRSISYHEVGLHIFGDNGSLLVEGIFDRAGLKVELA